MTHSQEQKIKTFGYYLKILSIVGMIGIGILQLATMITDLHYSAFESNSDFEPSRMSFGASITKSDVPIDEFGHTGQLNIQASKGSEGSDEGQVLQGFDRFFIIVMNLVENLIVAAGFYCLYRLFDLYHRGRIFVSEATSYFTKIGQLLGGYFLWDLLSPNLQNWYFYTFGQSKVIGLFFYPDFKLLIGSLFMMVLGYVMTKSLEISQEAELTI